MEKRTISKPTYMMAFLSAFQPYFMWMKHVFVSLLLSFFIRVSVDRSTINNNRNSYNIWNECIPRAFSPHSFNNNKNQKMIKLINSYSLCVCKYVHSFHITSHHTCVCLYLSVCSDKKLPVSLIFICLVKSIEGTMSFLVNHLHDFAIGNEIIKSTT